MFSRKLASVAITAGLALAFGLSATPAYATVVKPKPVHSVIHRVSELRVKVAVVPAKDPILFQSTGHAGDYFVWDAASFSNTTAPVLLGSIIELSKGHWYGYDATGNAPIASGKTLTLAEAAWKKWYLAN